MVTDLPRLGTLASLPVEGHADLLGAAMGGCVAYECFGAGQRVSQETYGGATWRSHPGTARRMFAVFGVVRRLHEMLVLLGQVPDSERLRDRVDALADGSPEQLLALDLDAVAEPVGRALRAHSAAVRVPPGPSWAGADFAGQRLQADDLARADLRGAVLIAADLRDVVLDRTDLLGADLRDARLDGADLSTALFLTQPQVAVARGDVATRLPPHLRRPLAWSAAST